MSIYPSENYARTCPNVTCSNISFSPILKVISLYWKFQSNSIILSFMPIVLCWAEREILTPHSWYFLLHRDLSIHMILCTFSFLSLSLLQERGREFSIWGFRDKELLIADQHSPPSFPVWICFLFPFLKCYRSKSLVVTHTVYAWLARHVWIQGMKLGSSFLLSIKTMFSSISFSSNKNDLSSKNPDFLSPFTTWVDKRNAIDYYPHLYCRAL